MNSRIYTGKVMHIRHSPVEHQFTYPLCFYAIDLDELDQLNRQIKGFGYNRWRPVSLHDRDYLKGPGGLKERIAGLVDLSGVDRIILVTVARFFTRVFNPVSFYYCLKKNGSPCAVVAEVNNTFKERHVYLLNAEGKFPLECRHEKQFHVSPFNPMDGEYEFTFSNPANHLRIEIRLVRGGEVIMEAALWGDGKELNTSNVWRTLSVRPFSAALTMPRILKQAAVLYFKKRLPVFKHPEPKNPMTIKV